jgi:hypothetical protein
MEGRVSTRQKWGTNVVYRWFQDKQRHWSWGVLLWNRVETTFQPWAVQDSIPGRSAYAADLGVSYTPHYFRMLPTLVCRTDLCALHLKLPYKHVYVVYSESNYVVL